MADEDFKRHVNEKHALLDPSIEARWEELKQTNTFFGVLLRCTFKEAARLALQGWAFGWMSLTEFLDRHPEIMHYLDTIPADLRDHAFGITKG